MTAGGATDGFTPDLDEGTCFLGTVSGTAAGVGFGHKSCRISCELLAIDCGSMELGRGAGDGTVLAAIPIGAFSTRE